LRTTESLTSQGITGGSVGHSRIAASPFDPIFGAREAMRTIFDIAAEVSLWWRGHHRDIGPFVVSCAVAQELVLEALDASILQDTLGVTLLRDLFEAMRTSPALRPLREVGEYPTHRTPRERAVAIVAGLHAWHSPEGVPRANSLAFAAALVERHGALAVDAWSTPDSPQLLPLSPTATETE
jgi:hypothetical protein